jgi:hypothetical protein
VKAGVPWAFLMAIGIVLAIEIVLHVRDERKIIAYASDTSQYQAVRDYMRHDGPAEVSLIGSSQMREGVTMPRLLEATRNAAGREVKIANYAARGAQVDADDAIIREMLRQPTQPRVIVIGLSVRDLRLAGQPPPPGSPDDAPRIRDWPRLALFWTAGDWWREFRHGGWAMTDVLPIVVRNYAGEALYTLKHREAISNAIARRAAPLIRRVDKDYFYNDPDEPNPIVGETSFQHLGNRGLRNLVESKLSENNLRKRTIPYYRFDPKHPEMAPEMVARLHAMVDQLRGSKAQVIVVEMPVAPQLRRLISLSRLDETFNTEMRTALAGTNIRFIPFSEQPFQPTNEHFSDLQHLNRPGAERFSDWLAGVIAESVK